MNRRNFFKVAVVGFHIGVVGTKLTPNTSIAANVYVKMIKNRKIHKQLQFMYSRLGDKILEGYHRMKQCELKYAINSINPGSSQYGVYQKAKKIVDIKD